jgi:hypothetical protein
LFERIKQRVASDEWQSSREAQATTLKGLSQLRADLDEQATEDYVRLLSAALDLPPERIAGCLQLDEFNDILRALDPDTKEQPVDDLLPTTGWLGKYLRHTSGTEIPTRWNFWCGMSVLAGALRRNVFMDVGYDLWPNLYLIIVEKAASKKTTAIKFGKGIITTMNRLLKARGVEDHQLIPLAPDSGTFVAFVEAIASQTIYVKDEFGRPQPVLADCTAYFAADDLVTLFSKHSFNVDSWIEGLTTLWDFKGPWVRESKAGGKHVLKDPALTFIGGTTMDWMRHGVTPTMVGGGFMSRCLWIIHPGGDDELHAYPRRLDPITELELAQSLVPLTLLPRRRVEQTNAYRAWYQAWYVQFKFEQSQIMQDDKLAAYYSRRHVMLHKISLLLAISEGRFVVDVPDGQLADAILRREEENLELAFAPISAHKDALLCELIVLKIHKSPGQTMTHSELLRFFLKRVGSTKKLKELMDTLHEGLRVIRTHKKNGIVYHAPVPVDLTQARIPDEPCHTP